MCLYVILFCGRVHVSAVPAETRSEFSGARVIGGCELSPLEEQPVLSTARSSLQP